MVQFSQCMDCKYFICNDNGIYKCKAYPEGIPSYIFWNKKNHDQNIDGDNGIKFEAVDGYYGKKSYEIYICDDTPYNDEENEFNKMSDEEFAEFEEKYMKERYGCDPL